MTLFTVAVITIGDTFVANHRAIRYAGLLVIMLGFALSTWSQYSLGKNWVPGIGLHINHKLIITGPFRHIRHPMYSGMLLSAIGICLATLNGWYGASVLVFCGAYALRAPIEDIKLRQQFGSEYAAYADQTGAIFPKFRKH